MSQWRFDYITSLLLVSLNSFVTLISLLCKSFQTKRISSQPLCGGQMKFKMSLVILNMFYLVFLSAQFPSSNKSDMFALPHCDLPCKYHCQLSLSTFAFSHPSHRRPTPNTRTPEQTLNITQMLMQTVAEETETEKKSKTKKQRVHNKHESCALPLSEWQAGRHNVHSEAGWQ